MACDVIYSKMANEVIRLCGRLVSFIKLDVIRFSLMRRYSLLTNLIMTLAKLYKIILLKKIS